MFLVIYLILIELCSLVIMLAYFADEILPNAFISGLVISLICISIFQFILTNPDFPFWKEYYTISSTLQLFLYLQMLLMGLFEWQLQYNFMLAVLLPMGCKLISIFLP